MPDKHGEPCDEGTRYAFGYTDKKPSLSYWVVVIIIVVGAIASAVFAVSGQYHG